LFNDSCVYAKVAPNVLGHASFEGKSFTLSHVLTNPSFQDYPGNPSAFQIISSQKSFAVVAKDPAEAAEWKEAFKQVDSGSSTGSRAPVWMPDSGTPTCMLCNMRFTFTQRRHHCRKCGTIICDNCSQTRALLPEIDSHPVRICDQCALSLGLMKENRGRPVVKKHLGRNTTLGKIFGTKGGTPSGGNETGPSGAKPRTSMDQMGTSPASSHGVQSSEDGSGSFKSGRKSMTSDEARLDDSDDSDSNSESESDKRNPFDVSLDSDKGDDELPELQSVPETQPKKATTPTASGKKSGSKVGILFDLSLSDPAEDEEPVNDSKATGGDDNKQQDGALGHQESAIDLLMATGPQGRNPLPSEELCPKGISTKELLSFLEQSKTEETSSSPSSDPLFMQLKDAQDEHAKEEERKRKEKLQQEKQEAELANSSIVPAAGDVVIPSQFEVPLSDDDDDDDDSDVEGNDVKPPLTVEQPQVDPEQLAVVEEVSPFEEVDADFVPPPQTDTPADDGSNPFADPFSTSEKPIDDVAAPPPEYDGASISPPVFVEENPFDVPEETKEVPLPEEEPEEFLQPPPVPPSEDDPFSVPEEQTPELDSENPFNV